MNTFFTALPDLRHMAIFTMFHHFLFGWRKASKCKKVIKKLQCRLSLLKNRRCSIVKQQRNDVVRLMEHGHYQTAFHRVDQIYKDECSVALYELLEHFCEILSYQLSYIRRNKKCEFPDDINEAISSLIYASARCADLPELLIIRKLFRQRYGEYFETAALEGKLVNFKIKEYLSMDKVSNCKLFKERSTIVSPSRHPLALEFTSEQHQQTTKDNNDHEVDATAAKQNALVVDSSSNDQFDFDFGQDESISNHVDSSESSTASFSQEIDDIEEHKSPCHDGSDQRYFIFKSAQKQQFLDLNIDKNYERWKKTTASSLDMVSPNCSDKTFNREKKNRALVDENKLSYMEIREPSKNMLCKPSENICVDDEIRSYPLPGQLSPHVHPKLPDYDDLVTKFTYLKKQYLQSQQ